MAEDTGGTSGPDLADIARRARWLVISTVARARAGHVGGPLSAIDVLATLFFEELNLRPDEPGWPDRDRFILSKGHSAIGLYAIMALRGYFPVEELETFDEGASRLQGHPDATKLPGIETSTGSLGQGLSVGMGMALGARLSGHPAHTFVMLGDGELQEGMIWEAVHSAPRYNLGNLTAIVDYNGLQQYGWPKRDGDRGDRRDPWSGIDLAAVFRAFGWRAVEFDGHDFDEIRAALRIAREGSGGDQPTVLIARTTKGRGLSFAEGSYRWHTGIATDEQLEQARRELTIEGDRS